MENNLYLKTSKQKNPLLIYYTKYYYAKTSTLNKYWLQVFAPCTKSRKLKISWCSKAAVCVYREGATSNHCAAWIRAGSSSKIHSREHKELFWRCKLLGAVCWERKQIKQTLLYMPLPCQPKLLPSQAEGKRNDPVPLKKLLLQEFGGPVYLSPYWEYCSSGGNSAVWVCLFCPSAYHYSDKTTLNKLTKALELNRVIVCALFAVALITWLCIQTEAIFTDFLSKELAFISIWKENIKGCIIIVTTTTRRRAEWNKACTHLLK